MNFKNPNDFLYFSRFLRAATLGLLSLLPLPAFAITGDNEQPIKIDSAQQSLDMQANTVTFSGKVILLQGTIDIRADKVVIIRPSGQQGKEIIIASGNPLTFYQMQDNGKPLKGKSKNLRYELAGGYLVLTDEAFLEQLDSNVKGDKITYLIKQQKVEAFSKDSTRVNTVLLPAQLQEKESTPPPAGRDKSPEADHSTTDNRGQ